jgi:outer membrane cobalamin receptor
MRGLACTIAITGLFQAGVAAAQDDTAALEDPEESAELEELSLEELLAVEIVTASNMREQLSRAPGVVIRLSREDLEARGYREVLDLLDDLPGMDVIRPWGDNYVKVYWRGYRTDVTHPFLLMIDGMVVNSLWSGDGSVIAAMPISEVDSVEVVYGPASAVYGANAFMGVVNVITAAGAGDEISVLRLRASAGAFDLDGVDTRILDGALIQERDGFRISVAGRLGLSFTDAGAAERGEYTRAGHAEDPALWGDYLAFENLARGARSPIREYGVDARVSRGPLEVGAWALTLDTGYGLVYPTDLVQPFARWIQYDRSAHVKHTADVTDQVSAQTMVRLRSSGISNQSYFLYAYQDAADQRVLELSYWQALNRSITVEEHVEAQVGEAITLLGGARYERKDLQSAYDVVAGPALPPDQVTPDVMLPSPPDDDLRSVERPQTDDVGVYAQARLRRAGVVLPGDAHALHLGVRYDHNSTFGDAHSPTLRVGYVGELDGRHGLFLGKLLYGEGFHEPNPRQLYGGWLGSGSDPTLRPETSRTLEVNLSHTTAHLSNLVSGYYVQNDDTIVQVPGGAANEGERTVVGVDYHVSALLRPGGPVDRLALWGYYSFIRGEEAISGGDSAPIGDLATHKAWLGATAALLGRVTATARVRAIGDRQTVATNPVREINGVAIVDLGARLDRVGETPVSVQLQVDNLLGTAYSHPGIRTAEAGEEPGGSLGFYNSRLPQPGRRVVVTVGIDL